MSATKSHLNSSVNSFVNTQSNTRSTPHAWLYVHPDPMITQLAAEETVAEALGIDPERVHHHQNVVWLRAEADVLSLKRNDIQAILNELSLSVSNSDFGRWVVIEAAHQLTPEAANALLKVIEEPPPNTQLILTTTGATRVMSTLRSRTALRSFASSTNTITSESENSEELRVANEFLDGSVSHRLGIIAQQHKAGQLSNWLENLNHALRLRQAWSDLEWLQQNQINRGTNVRLVAETFAVREWLK